MSENENKANFLPHEDLIRLIVSLGRNPEKYIGKKDIDCAFRFIDAYIQAMFESAGEMQIFHLHHFSGYLLSKYRMSPACGHYDCVRCVKQKTDSKEEAWNLFFSEYHGFIEAQRRDRKEGDV